MSRRTFTRAPDPHAAPPVAIATRRDLFGTIGALLLLTAAEAGPAKAAELDGELLEACAAFQLENAPYVIHRKPGGNSSMPDDVFDALCDRRWDAIDSVVALRARTPEGLQAKAAALQAILAAEVPVKSTDTFDGCAGTHERLAMSLCRDLLGRAGT